MIIKNTGSFFVGHLEDRSVPEKDRAKLMSLANEEFADELADMLEEAFPIAAPVVLFGVCPVASDAQQVSVNGIVIPSDLAYDKL